MRRNTPLGQKVSAPQLSIRVDWDQRHKKWRLTAIVRGAGGTPRVLTATADTTAEMDVATAHALLKLVATDLESRLL